MGTIKTQSCFPINRDAVFIHRFRWSHIPDSLTKLHKSVAIHIHILIYQATRSLFLDGGIAMSLYSTKPKAMYSDSEPNEIPIHNLMSSARDDI